MNTLGNIIWLIFGGLLSAIAWMVEGCIWCITIVGIPVGKQCFKFATLTLSPFGTQVVSGGGAGAFILNIFWFFLTGLPMALIEFVWGCLFCITIVGIPFGKQHFKLARLALAPFGTMVW